MFFLFLYNFFEEVANSRCDAPKLKYEILVRHSDYLLIIFNRVGPFRLGGWERYSCRVACFAELTLPKAPASAPVSVEHSKYLASGL